MESGLMVIGMVDVKKTCYELKCKDCMFRNHQKFCDIARADENKPVGDVLIEINNEVFKVVEELMATNNKKGQENNE